MLKNIVKIYYNSDFTLNVKLPDGYDSQEFIIRLYTTDKEKYFEASYISGEYTNCLVDDDQIVVYVNNHGLDAGCLHLWQEYDYTNTHFADNVENIETGDETNIYLVKQNANATSARYVGSALPDLTGTADFITQSDLEFELLNYPTKDDIENAGYISEADLNNYVTDEELEDKGYMTLSELEDKGYATTEYVNNQTRVKQDRLISGVNIKTVNGNSLLGNGNINISGVSQDDLDNAIAELVTQSQLTEATQDFVTSEDIAQMDLIDQEDIEQMGFVTASQVQQMGFATQSFVDDAIADAIEDTDFVTPSDLATKQDTLVSGTNIKTINGTSLLGSGNLVVTGDENLIESISVNGNVQTIVNKNVDITVPTNTNQLTNGAGFVDQTGLSNTLADYVTSSDLQTELNDYATDTELQTAISGKVEVVQLTQAQYNALTPAEQSDNTKLYVITDAQGIDLSDYVTNTELQTAISGITVPTKTSDLTNDSGFITVSALNGYATETYVDDAIDDIDLSSKQDTLVSGINIKTINGESILGSGDITIQGDGSEDYSHVLEFTAEQANSTIKLNRVGTNTTLLANASLQYSTDNGNTWNDYTIGNTITLSNIGDSVKFKGTNTALAVDGSNYHRFTMTGKIKATGDITSLFNEVGGDFSMPSYGCLSLFDGCTSLTKAPDLPATTLANSCYSSMFYGCTSLTKAPDLPATTLASGCYYFMFKNCTSLTKAPDLPATTLANNCYRNMFEGCTSLTKAPELPATTLAHYCYSIMFSGCTSLTKTPDLPATTLADSCYLNMFNGCTSLTKAPDLPATTLVDSCYRNMFDGCTRLRYIKVWCMSDNTNNMLTSWVQNVASTGTIVIPQNSTMTTVGVSGIPSGWTVERMVQMDTDDLPESYVGDNGKTLQVVDGVWTKVTASSGAGGDTNVIESVSVNGTALTPDANKNVDITVPTNTNQLTNGAGFITSSSIPNVSVTDSGSGNAVTGITASGHSLTVTKGSTFLTSANFVYDSTTNTLTINV